MSNASSFYFSIRLRFVDFPTALPENFWNMELTCNKELASKFTPNVRTTSMSQRFFGILSGCATKAPDAELTLHGNTENHNTAE